MTRESIHDWFSRVARDAGGTPAIDSGDRQIGYAALEARSNRLANFLLASGIAKDAPVGILADDVTEVIASVLAVLKAGAVFVPLDPRTPERRLRAMIEEVSVRWFVAEGKFAPAIASITPHGAPRPKVLFLDGVPASPVAGDLDVLDGFEGATDEDARPTVARDPDGICYVYFTSGSTGRPKGIAGRLKAIDHFVRWEIDRVRDSRRESPVRGPA